jgi:hypothetical protein
MDEVFSSWPDLTKKLISHLDIVDFTDDSSFFQEGTRFAGYAVVTLHASDMKHICCQSRHLHKRVSSLLSYG